MPVRAYYSVDCDGAFCTRSYAAAAAELQSRSRIVKGAEAEGWRIRATRGRTTRVLCPKCIVRIEGGQAPPQEPPPPAVLRP